MGVPRVRELFSCTGSIPILFFLSLFPFNPTTVHDDLSWNFDCMRYASVQWVFCENCVFCELYPLLFCHLDVSPKIKYSSVGPSKKWLFLCMWFTRNSHVHTKYYKPAASAGLLLRKESRPLWVRQEERQLCMDSTVCFSFTFFILLSLKS